MLMEDKEEAFGGIYIGNNALSNISNNDSTDSVISDNSQKSGEIILRFVIIKKTVWN